MMYLYDDVIVCNPFTIYPVCMLVIFRVVCYGFELTLIINILVRWTPNPKRNKW